MSTHRFKLELPCRSYVNWYI